jgi:ribosome-binding factor A
MTTSRAVRVADQVRRVLADLLREAGDKRLALVTVTEVRMSPDLKHARVFITSLDENERRATMRVLARAAPFLRRSLAGRAELRFTPELRFEYDATLEGGLRVERILDELHLDDRREGAEGDDGNAVDAPTDPAPDE